jgi:hypothetical protein
MTMPKQSWKLLTSHCAMPTDTPVSAMMSGRTVLTAFCKRPPKMAPTTMSASMP